MTTRLILVGGFLGAGKTTLLLKAAAITTKGTIWLTLRWRTRTAFRCRRSAAGASAAASPT
jgi:hypothetical protein